MNWDDFILEESKKEYFINLLDFIDKEREMKKIYPAKENVFKAFEFTPFNKVKCVILGQDPYHNENQAHGLAFSVKKEVKFPPSLVNIFKELYDDIGVSVPKDGDLSTLAKEGVFLLNTILTVEENKPLSHINKGWEEFTLKAIKLLNEDDNPKVFILWGNNARSYKKYLTNKNHLVIEGPHPSPLSSYRGFLNSKPFSKTNEYLKSKNIEPINWKI